MASLAKSDPMEEDSLDDDDYTPPRVFLVVAHGGGSFTTHGSVAQSFADYVGQNYGDSIYPLIVRLVPLGRSAATTDDSDKITATQMVSMLFNEHGPLRASLTKGTSSRSGTSGSGSQSLNQLQSVGVFTPHVTADNELLDIEGGVPTIIEQGGKKKTTFSKNVWAEKFGVFEYNWRNGEWPQCFNGEENIFFDRFRKPQPTSVFEVTNHLRKLHGENIVVLYLNCSPVMDLLSDTQERARKVREQGVVQVRIDKSLEQLADILRRKFINLEGVQRRMNISGKGQLAAQLKTDAANIAGKGLKISASTSTEGTIAVQDKDDRQLIYTWMGYWLKQYDYFMVTPLPITNSNTSVITFPIGSGGVSDLTGVIDFAERIFPSMGGAEAQDVRTNQPMLITFAMLLIILLYSLDSAHGGMYDIYEPRRGKACETEEDGGEMTGWLCAQCRKCNRRNSARCEQCRAIGKPGKPFGGQRGRPSHPYGTSQSNAHLRTGGGGVHTKQVKNDGKWNTAAVQLAKDRLDRLWHAADLIKHWLGYNQPTNKGPRSNNVESFQILIKYACIMAFVINNVEDSAQWKAIAIQIEQKYNDAKGYNPFFYGGKKRKTKRRRKKRKTKRRRKTKHKTKHKTKRSRKVKK
jgi:hypothetical protein